MKRIIGLSLMIVAGLAVVALHCYSNTSDVNDSATIWFVAAIICFVKGFYFVLDHKIEKQAKEISEILRILEKYIYQKNTKISKNTKILKK